MDAYRVAKAWPLAAMLMAQGALAGGLDWSQPVICAALSTAECRAGQDCRSGGADSMDMPVFVRIDLGARLMTAVGPELEPMPRRIQVLEESGRRLILQGAEDGRGWTGVVDRISGRMVTSASDGEVGYLVFSACTSMLAPKPD